MPRPPPAPRVPSWPPSPAASFGGDACARGPGDSAASLASGGSMYSTAEAVSAADLDRLLEDEARAAASSPVSPDDARGRLDAAARAVVTPPPLPALVMSAGASAAAALAPPAVGWNEAGGGRDEQEEDDDECEVVRSHWMRPEGEGEGGSEWRGSSGADGGAGGEEERAVVLVPPRRAPGSPRRRRRARAGAGMQRMGAAGRPPRRLGGEGSSCEDDDGDADGTQVVVVDDVRSALLDSANPADGMAGQIVELGDGEVVQYPEGHVLGAEEEAAVVQAGRQMFARSRNHAMIWGSARSTGAQSSLRSDEEDVAGGGGGPAPPAVAVAATTTTTAVAATTTAAAAATMTAAATATTQEPALLPRSEQPVRGPSHSSSLSAGSAPPSSKESAALTTTTITSATSTASLALARVGEAVGGRRGARAVALLLSRAPARCLSPYEAAMRGASDGLPGESPAVRGAADALTVAARAARVAQATAPRALPPAGDGAPWARNKKAASFSSGFAFGDSVAVVGALLATAGGHVSLRQAPRVGVGAASGASMDVVLAVSNGVDRLAATATLTARTDGSGVDVRLACEDSLLNRRKRRRAFDAMLRDAEAAWRSVGVGARMSVKERAAAAVRARASTGAIGKDVLKISARRHSTLGA